MGIIVNPLGFSTTLAEDLMVGDETIKLNDTTLLDSMMSKGDTAYLQVGDGVSQVEIEITRASIGYKFSFQDKTISFRCGSKVVFHYTDRVIENMLGQALRDAVGDVVRLIKSSDEDQLKVSTENGTVTLTPTAAVAGGLSLDAICSLEISSDFDYLAGCKDGEPVLVDSAGGAGGDTVAAGEGIEIAGTSVKTISLEQLHSQNQIKNGLTFNLMGQYISGDLELDSGGIFAEDIDLPPNEFIPSFTVINGQVVAIGASDIDTDGVKITGTGVIDVSEGSQGFVVSHEETFAGIQSTDVGLTFDKSGHLTEIDPDYETKQRYAKTPWLARASFFVWGGETNAFEMVVGDNITAVTEGIRGGSFVNYEFEFGTPAPSLDYYISMSGAGVRPGSFVKTLNGFTCILYGYGNEILGEGNKQLVDVIVSGPLVAPSSATNYQHVPLNIDPE